MCSWGDRKRDCLLLVSKLEVLDSKLEVLDSELQSLDFILDTQSF